MTTTTSEAADRPLPLFYRKPVVLRSTVHGAWRLKDGDFGFAAETAFVPIVGGEFVETSRCYPVLFAGTARMPVAVLGLADGINLFVENGRWAEGQYVPAYVRRYPFGFVEIPDSDRFALAIDVAAGRVVEQGDEGAPLFENGEPSALTRQALQFCEAYQGEFRATKAFVDALREKDLIVEQRADVTLPDGRKYALNGFGIVDEKRFRELDDATIVDWHRKGFLSLITLHLASLARMGALMERQGRRK